MAVLNLDRVDLWMRNYIALSLINDGQRNEYVHIIGLPQVLLAFCILNIL